MSDENYCWCCGAVDVVDQDGSDKYWCADCAADGPTDITCWTCDAIRRRREGTA